MKSTKSSKKKNMPKEKSRPQSAKDWLAGYQRRCEEGNVTTKDKIKELLPQLAAAGIKTITLSFHGSGDEGCIVNVTVDANGEFDGWPDKFKQIKSPVEDLAYEVLEIDFSGWEENQGSYGDVIFDVEAGKVSLKWNTFAEVSSEKDYK